MNSKPIRLLAVILMLLVLITAAGCSAGESEIKSFEDVNKSGFKLGTAQGSLSQVKAEKRFPKAEIKYFDSVSDGYTAVRAGKVDGFAFDKVVLEHYLRSDETTVMLDEDYGSCNVCAGLPKESTKLLKQVNDIIRSFKADGTLAEMEARWIESENPQMPDLEKPENPVGTLRIISEGLTEPFTYISEGGECIGLDIELGARIAYSLNMDYSVQTMGFGSILPALEAGKGDIILSELNETAERSKEINFSEPYYISKLGIAVKSDRYTPVQSSSSGFANTDDTDTAASAGDSITEKLKSSFERTFTNENRWQLIAEGLLTTIIISILAYILGSLWGAALCAMNRAKATGLRIFSAAYSRIITGIPALVWLMILYYIVFRKADISGIAVAVIGFALVTGASLSGIFNAGLNAVDKGQCEAAAALGFRQAEIFRRIVFPQAAGHAFGLYKGQFVSLVKETSIVGYIAIMDLTKASDIIRSRTYQAFFPLITTALIYFAVTCVFIALLTVLERRLDPRKRKNILKGVRTR